MRCEALKRLGKKPWLEAFNLAALNLRRSNERSQGRKSQLKASFNYYILGKM
jgi:hypothetical protein